MSYCAGVWDLIHYDNALPLDTARAPILVLGMRMRTTTLYTMEVLRANSTKCVHVSDADGHYPSRPLAIEMRD